MFPDAQDITEVTLGADPVTIEEFVAVARYGARVDFAPAYRDRVRGSRRLIERFLEENRVVYGVTTGFGDNVTETIAPGDAAELQRNIVLSHAVSVGEPLPTEMVRAVQMMMLVGLGKGFSGVSLEVLELIRGLLNARVTPHAPGEGSVGYLAPEAHMAMVLLGEGRARVGDELLPGAAALQRVGLSPVVLGCKEGLTLTNGTHSITALAVLACYDAARAAAAADIAAATSVEALRGNVKHFDPRYQSVKRHPEQAAVAANLLRLLDGSAIAEANRDYRVQDAYSLRAIPQIHGGAKRAIKDAIEIIREELDSVGDNPAIIPEGDDGVALMGANFDGTFVGLASDLVANAVTVLAKVSERRTDRLVNSAFSELPAFLSPDPGLHNGYMIPQYTSAALYMEMKAASVPATVDSVPTCANQEDAVSNAYLAARKAYDNARRLRYVIAIELMCAAQGKDLLDEALGEAGEASQAVQRTIRKVAATVTKDRFFGDEIEAIERLVADGTITRVAENVVGAMAF